MTKKLTQAEKEFYKGILSECDPSNYSFAKELNLFGWLRILNARFQLAYDNTGWRGGLRFKQEISIPEKHEIAAALPINPMLNKSINELNTKSCADVETGWFDRITVQELGSEGLFNLYNTVFGNHEDLVPWHTAPRPQDDGYGTPLSKIKELGNKFYPEVDMDAPLHVVQAQLKEMIAKEWNRRQTTTPKRFDEKIYGSWHKYSVLALVDFEILCKWHSIPYEFRAVFEHFLPKNMPNSVYHEKLAKQLRNDLMGINTLWAIRQSCEVLQRKSAQITG